MLYFRLVATVMALLADKPELDFTCWNKNRDDYFLAIQAEMGGNYKPMQVFVRLALRDAEQGVL
ncbi:MAG: hypothetical protein JKY88_15480 [Pseudomonadales bacterium]|nr:hypothetical protein [Pseudomonadales bacterium]